MLMSDGECDSMFDLDGMLEKPEDPFLHHGEEDPFAHITNAVRLSVDRQASLEDLAHVIRADSHLAAPAITDAADTIQDLAKYLKDDSRSSPTLSGPFASFPSSSGPPPPPPTPVSVSPDPDHAPMHNYASRRPGPAAASSAYKIGSRFPVLIKQERPDTPESGSEAAAAVASIRGQRSPGRPTVRPAIQSLDYSLLYAPHGSALLRRKRPIVYKEEAQDGLAPEEEDDDGQERDGNLPPPRKYVRKNPKQIKDMEEYRKRRERNNEAVRRARAKKRQTEALIHSENRQLRQENQRLSTQLEASRLQIQTQERIIAQLRGQAPPPPTHVQPQRIKKAPRRLAP